MTLPLNDISDTDITADLQHGCYHEYYLHEITETPVMTESFDAYWPNFQSDFLSTFKSYHGY